eukprot:scaffold1508_cov178-Amphora_coffeaeformis.AAC.28
MAPPLRICKIRYYGSRYGTIAESRKIYEITSPARDLHVRVPSRDDDLAMTADSGERGKEQAVVVDVRYM